MRSVIKGDNICAVNEEVLRAVGNFAGSQARKGACPPIFVIVPDRFTLQAERILLAASPVLLNVRVVTFSMLFNILTADKEVKVLDKTSAVLFMWRAIREVRADLQYFGRVVDMYAFGEKMFNTVNQLQSSLADMDKLEGNARTEVTRRKMHDIQIIYKRYKELTAEYIDGSGVLGWLIDHLCENEVIKESYVYLTAFGHLSVQRAKVVEILERVAKSFIMGVQSGSEMALAM